MVCKQKAVAIGRITSKHVSKVFHPHKQQLSKNSRLGRMDNNRKTDSYDFDEVDADDTQASDQENMEVGEGI